MTDVATAIKESVSCLQFADFIGLKVNRSGFAVCPFHNDSDASLKIYRGGRGWCCFGCHKGGDVINFASLYYGLNFTDTIKRLNEDFNLGLLEDQTEQDRVLAAVQLAKRKAERMKAEREKAAFEVEYWIAYEKWLASCRKVMDNEPPRDGEATDEFCNALFERERNYDELKHLEVRRIDCDHKSRSNSGF